MGARGAPAPGHRCCVVDLSSFFFPVDQWGKETTGRRPSGEQSTPSLCSLCGLRRHYLTRPRVSSAPHTPAFRERLLWAFTPSRRKVPAGWNAFITLVCLFVGLEHFSFSSNATSWGALTDFLRHNDSQTPTRPSPPRTPHPPLPAHCTRF